MSLFTDPTTGEDLADCLVDVVRQMAVQAIEDAAGGDSGKLAEAQSHVDVGDQLRSQDKFNDAAAAYRLAIASAEGEGS